MACFADAMTACSQANFSKTQGLCRAEFESTKLLSRATCQVPLAGVVYFDSLLTQQKVPKNSCASSRYNQPNNHTLEGTTKPKLHSTLQFTIYVQVYSSMQFVEMNC